MIEIHAGRNLELNDVVVYVIKLANQQLRLLGGPTSFAEDGGRPRDLQYTKLRYDELKELMEKKLTPLLLVQ